MKLMIASDIHGSAYYCKKLFEAYGFIIGDPIYNSQPKVKNDLKDLLLK